MGGAVRLVLSATVGGRDHGGADLRRREVLQIWGEATGAWSRRRGWRDQSTAMTAGDDLLARRGRPTRASEDGGHDSLVLPSGRRAAEPAR
ncbi:hypothetical protein GUJ93_ZPchr0252g33443 [Zizania palustris]|uniref:Uncharacterized protein n=1 Tax=Zizania palustris TaxID=103762 RepID=A0A8J5V088_ZIZPA|nr:hypothetical protein GUJ93_ZPchr0252g33443 [Zizania palustris]